MQEKNIYEYAIIRLVPKVEREEFFNVGLVLFCKHQKFIRIQYHLCQDKFALIAPDLEYETVLENLEAFQKIADGTSLSSPIAQLDIAERFRWLTALRSSVIQTSRPHSGKTHDLEKTFQRLFEEMVE